MPKKPQSKSGWRKIVEFLQTPLGLVLVSSIFIGGGAKIYSDRQAAAADLEVRRSAYVELLAEYQHRVVVLGGADSELNKFIGDGLAFKAAKPISDCGPDRREWEELSAAVGRKEADILRGVGDYVPTAPQFAAVDLLTLAARMERTAGMPDYELGGMRMLGLLSVSPDILWLFVRSQYPALQKFGVTRHVFFTTGEIPLARGSSLTKSQEARLGWPDLKPGDLERVQRRNDQLSAKLDHTLKKLEGPDPCQKKSAR